MLTRNLTILLFVIFQITSTYGQNQLGFRFFHGINQQNTETVYLISEGKSIDYRVDLKSMSNSQSVGLFAQFNFGFLYLQPEFLYTNYSVSYQVEDYYVDGPSSLNIEEKIQQIDLPINAGLLYKGFRLGGGPVFHFVQSINSDFNTLKNTTIDTKSIKAGFQGSLGYDWKIFHFDIRYQGDFNPISDHVYFNNSNIGLKSTPSSILLGIAMAINNKR